MQADYTHATRNSRPPVLQDSSLLPASSIQVPQLKICFQTPIVINNTVITAAYSISNSRLRARLTLSRPHTFSTMLLIALKLILLSLTILQLLFLLCLLFYTASYILQA